MQVSGKNRTSVPVFFSKTLNDFPDKNEETSVGSSLVGFIHAEVQDENDISRTVTKLIKNLKWAAGKNNSKNIVLHSFAHLSEVLCVSRQTVNELIREARSLSPWLLHEGRL